MSTVFKLLGSDPNTDEEEVNRIVGLEKEFNDVWISLLLAHCKTGGLKITLKNWGKIYVQ